MFTLPSFSSDTISIQRLCKPIMPEQPASNAWKIPPFCGSPMRPIRHHLGTWLLFGVHEAFLVSSLLLLGLLGVKNVVVVSLWVLPVWLLEI